MSAFTAKHLDIDAKKIVKDVTVTVKVKGLSHMRFRLWIASRIIVFGILISGMNCKVEEWD